MSFLYANNEGKHEKIIKGNITKKELHKLLEKASKPLNKSDPKKS